MVKMSGYPECVYLLGSECVSVFGEGEGVGVGGCDRGRDKTPKRLFSCSIEQIGASISKLDN